jgi:NAD(P)-dependent dehydrogenase (short-subunit alcohol dehydrogenase family)
VRTYVVTGAASGIGAACARMLRDQGARVVSVDLRGADVDVDLSDHDARSALPARVLDASNGQVDALITCAGLRAAAPDTVSVNFFGSVELALGLRAALRESPAPRIAMVSSMASVSASDPRIVNACLSLDEASARLAATESQPDHAGRPRVYSSSKTAVSRWIRQNAALPEWAGDGILLNAVAPGTVRTAMTVDVTASPEAEAAWLAGLPNPQNRIGAPEEIAAALIWLASAENSMAVGQTLFADLGTEVILRGDNIW